MKNKAKYAGIFVVLLFILSALTIPIQAEVSAEQAEVSTECVQRRVYEYDYDENPEFPDELPDGMSSITCITAIREFSFWQQSIYDIGFTVWAMRARDGNPHTWEFDGELFIKYDSESGDTEIVPLNLYDTWTGTTYLRFDIVIEDLVIHPVFYTMLLVGNIYADGVYQRSYSRTFYGLDYSHEPWSEVEVTEQQIVDAVQL